MFEITLLARLRGLNVIYSLLSRFHYSLLYVILEQSNAKHLHLDILYPEKPITHILRETALLSSSSDLWDHLPAKSMVINSPLLPCCYVALNF